MSETQGLLMVVDQIAKEQGLTQQRFAQEAGLDDTGKTISRAIYRNDCKLSVFLRMVNAIGYELVLRKR